MKNLNRHKGSPGISPSASAQKEASDFFRDILESGLSLRVRVTGRSMAPFLTGGEVVILKKVPLSGLRKGDIIFVCRDGSSPVLHRLVRKKRTDDNRFIFQTRGDALVLLDAPVRHDEVLGKVCRIERIHPAAGMEGIDMESLQQKVMNYLRAMFCLFETYRYSAGLRLFGPGGLYRRNPSRRRPCGEEG